MFPSQHNTFLDCYPYTHVKLFYTFQVNINDLDFSFLINFSFYWRIIALQNFAVFCQTSTWISHRYTYQFTSVQFSRSVMSDSVTPWTAACQASLSFIISWSLLKLVSTELVMPSNHTLIYDICFFLSDFLCMTLSRSIYVSTNNSVLLLVIAEQYRIVCIHHIFFISSSIDGHLGWFHVLAIVNSVAMNDGVHVSFWIMIFSGYRPRRGIAG